MVLIAELSDEPIYTIKTVVSQTGILAVTLRAWETRYAVLKPHRARNRYRLYSEKDIAILRWLQKRTEEGVSISSAVAEWNKLVKAGQWPEAIPAAQAVKGTSAHADSTSYVNTLYDALVKRDEPRADGLFQQIFSTFDLQSACVDVLVPCLQQIGEAWYRGEVGITVEHFSSTYLRGKLSAIFQTYPGGRNTPRILVGTAPSEHHEIGALITAVLLRSLGYRVEYLGADIPLEDLIAYSRHEKPAMIVLTATLQESAEGLRPMMGLLGQLNPRPLFGFGGQAFNTDPVLRNQIRGEFLGGTISNSLERIDELLPLSPKKRG